MQRKRPSAPARPKATKQAKSPGKTASPSAAADGRRGELVLAAYRLIAERGLEELRTRDIAAEVGINIATLHYYFRTKEQLIAAVVEHMALLFRTLRAPLAEGASPLEELRHLFKTQLYRRRVEPALETVVQEMLLRSRRDDDVRAQVERLLLGWNQYVEAIIARGVREGDFASDIEPKLAAAIVTSFSIGMNLQHGVKPASFPLEAAHERVVSWLLSKS
jgi:AcrR family transcriptional regulator